MGSSELCLEDLLDNKGFCVLSKLFIALRLHEEIVVGGEIVSTLPVWQGKSFCLLGCVKSTTTFSVALLGGGGKTPATTTMVEVAPSTMVFV